jgi:hypothetical protein
MARRRNSCGNGLWLRHLWIVAGAAGENKRHFAVRFALPLHRW